MIDVEEAISLMHKKEMIIHKLCFDFDKSLFSMRQKLQLPVNREQWTSEFSTRLTLYNKEYRRTVKHDLQAVATRLRQVYGNKVVQSGPIIDIHSRLSFATDAFNTAEELFREYSSIYDARVLENAFPPEDRIVFKRAFPRLRSGLADAKTYLQSIRDKLTKWEGYFDVLVSEDKLSALFTYLRAGKITKANFEEKATSPFNQIGALCDERDVIVAAASKLALTHETAWLARGRKGIRDRTFRQEMAKYDPLFQRAVAQKETYAAALEEAQRIASLAYTPEVFPGPHGDELSVILLREAYAEFQSVQAACDALQELLTPITDMLERNIAHMQAFEPGVAAAATK